MARLRAERRHYPLRVHLLLLVVGTLVPVLVLSALLVRQLVADNRAAAERRLLQVARSQATVVDAEISATIRTLQALAESPRLDTGDLAGFHAQATRVGATQPSWFSVMLSRPDGRQILNTSRAWGTAPLPTFAVDTTSIAYVVTNRLPAVGSLRRGPLDRTLSVPIRVPVVRGGELRFILSAIVTAEQFGRLVERDGPDANGWTRGIVDAEGTIIARTRNPERFVGQPVSRVLLTRSGVSTSGVYSDISLDGEQVYAAFSRAPVSGWVISVAAPRAEMDGPLRQSMLALGGLGLALMAICGAGAFVLSRRVSHDIADAAAAAEALAGGLPPSLRDSTVTEVRSLGRSLSRSAQLIEVHTQARDEQFTHVEAARARAEAADRAKDDFLAMLGHELRNPLAPVLTALHLMRARGETGVLRERDVIERQVRHLSDLVDDLLDVSRLRRGKVTLRHTRFELITAVGRAAEIAEPMMIERNHHFVVDVPATGLPIDGDETRIAQVIANLLTNAAKYTDPGGRILLRARAEDQAVMVECEDNGTGISPDLLPRLFDLFEQGERSLDRGMGGLGLGLSVAKSLTELHGGTIQAESDGAGLGSRFIVRLPLAAGEAVAARGESPVASIADQVSARVLVVDDNRDAVDMLVTMFAFAGFTARGAVTGEEALAMAPAFCPDVAVLDIGLPGMDGFELARRLRDIEVLRHTRLVALTGYGQDGDVAAAYAAGFDMHMVKPGDADALIDFIRVQPSADAAGTEGQTTGG